MLDGNKTSDEKTNASQYGKVYYARHMQPGVCGYGNETVLVDTDGMKAMIGNEAIGKPVYILHNTAAEDDRLKNLEKESAGYIIDSFYNELDGWAWFKFIATTDACHSAIAKGWAVSNAYRPTEWGPGGKKNNVTYDREIVNGCFTHLAIVPDPRYEDACIMTPEKFRDYQDSKKRELEELRNSKDNPPGGKQMFKLFKTKREEVSEIDPDTQIELEGGKIISLREMMNSVKMNSEDEAKKKAEKDEKDKEEKENAEKKNREKMNGDSMVDCEGEKMPLKELVNKYNEMEKKNAEEAESEANKKKKEEEESGEEGDKKNRKEKKNSMQQAEEAANDHFKELMNASGIKPSAPQIVDTGMDRVARGKQKYGSAT